MLSACSAAQYHQYTMLRSNPMRAASWSWLLIACAPSTTPPPEDGVTLVILPPTAARTMAIDPVTPDAASAPSAEDRRTSPLDVPARDVRTTPPRSKAIVLMELQQLDALYSTMQPSAVDAPVVLRRLADDYLELHRADASVLAARKAILHYAKLVANYPSALQLDQSMYSLGLEYELVGDNLEARKVYFELISKQPSSKWVPYAYFAFGEFFVKDAKSDPSNWALAQQSYEAAKKQSSTPLNAWTLWRLMQVERVMGRSLQANTYENQLRSSYPQSDAVKRIGERL